MAGLFCGRIGGRIGTLPDFAEGTPGVGREGGRFRLGRRPKGIRTTREKAERTVSLRLEVGAHEESGTGHIDELLQLLGRKVIVYGRNPLGSEGFITEISVLHRAHHGNAFPGLQQRQKKLTEIGTMILGMAIGRMHSAGRVRVRIRAIDRASRTIQWTNTG